MKVKELLDELLTMDGEAEVLVSVWNYDLLEFNNVLVVDVAEDIEGAVIELED